MNNKHKLILEDISSIEFKEIKKPGKFKKIFILVLGIFLTILILVYFLIGSLDNIVYGLIESNKIKDNEVSINPTNRLVFLENTYDKLLNIYNENSELEFKVCLNGYTENGNYFIDEIYAPKTYLQSHDRVIADFCNNESIVDLHSHPLKHCLPSEQDFISFKLFKEKNENAIMAVMCEKGRFNFYN